MMSLPYVMAYESFMIGPTQGFDVNGAAFVVPECKKHYIVLNGTYDRPETIFHSYSHKIEAIMKKVVSRWSSTDRNRYWEKFAVLGLYDRSLPLGAYCGNGHFSSNSTDAYDYSNSVKGFSQCSDWSNFPSLRGETASVSCTEWECTDEGWQRYWFSHIPRNNGTTTLRGSDGREIVVENNWWKYILYPERVLETP
jgi:hypothetical protein